MVLHLLLLHTSFHLGMLAGSSTSPPESQSTQPLTPRLLRPWPQVGCVQLDPASIPKWKLVCNSSKCNTWQ